MKNLISACFFRCRFVLGAIVLFVATPSFAGEWTPWDNYASMHMGGFGTVELQWRLYRPSGEGNHLAQWRVINDTNRTLYDVTIERKIYICSDGREAAAAGEWIANVLSPGARKGTMSDDIGQDRCSRITHARFEIKSEVVQFSLDKSSFRKGWGEYGPVQH